MAPRSKLPSAFHPNLHAINSNSCHHFIHRNCGPFWWCFPPSSFSGGATLSRRSLPLLSGWCCGDLSLPASFGWCGPPSPPPFGVVVLLLPPCTNNTHPQHQFIISVHNGHKHKKEKEGRIPKEERGAQQRHP